MCLCMHTQKQNIKKLQFEGHKKSTHIVQCQRVSSITTLRTIRRHYMIFFCAHSFNSSLTSLPKKTYALLLHFHKQLIMLCFFFTDPDAGVGADAFVLYLLSLKCHIRGSQLCRGFSFSLNIIADASVLNVKERMYQHKTQQIIDSYHHHHHHHRRSYNNFRS